MTSKNQPSVGAMPALSTKNQYNHFLKIFRTLPNDLQKLINKAQWEAISEGESDAEMYRLRDDNRVRYLKISSQSAQYPVNNDYLRLQWLSGKIAVPQILHYSETDSHQYLLMSDCAGLHPLHDNLRWTVEARIQLLAAAAKMFHAIPIDDCPYRLSFDEQIALAQNNMEKGLIRAKKVNNQGRSIEDLFAEFVSLKPTTEDWVLTHGDLYPINIRVDEQSHTVTGFIDVGTMAVADRYTDLALIVNAIGWHHDKKWIATFFEQYGLAIDADKLRFYQLMQAFL